MKFRYFIAAGVAAMTAAPGAAQSWVAGQRVGPPGSKDSAAAAIHSVDQNSSYNRLISRVGVLPSKKSLAEPAVAKPRAVPATPADIVVGANVRDVNGVDLADIDSIEGDSAVLVFDTGLIRYPLIGFGKDKKGLLISLTEKEFLAAVANANKGS